MQKRKISIKNPRERSSAVCYNRGPNVERRRRYDGGQTEAGRIAGGARGGGDGALHGGRLHALRGAPRTLGGIRPHGVLAGRAAALGEPLRAAAPESSRVPAVPAAVGAERHARRGGAGLRDDGGVRTGGDILGAAPAARTLGPRVDLPAAGGVFHSDGDGGSIAKGPGHGPLQWAHAHGESLRDAPRRISRGQSGHGVDLRGLRGGVARSLSAHPRGGTGLGAGHGGGRGGGGRFLSRVALAGAGGARRGDGGGFRLSGDARVHRELSRAGALPGGARPRGRAPRRGVSGRRAAGGPLDVGAVARAFLRLAVRPAGRAKAALRGDLRLRRGVLRGAARRVAARTVAGAGPRSGGGGYVSHHGGRRGGGGYGGPFRAGEGDDALFHAHRRGRGGGTGGGFSAERPGYAVGVVPARGGPSPRGSGAVPHRGSPARGIFALTRGKYFL